MVAQLSSLRVQLSTSTVGLLVVAVSSRLSPQAREATAMLWAGELGSLFSINAVFWQGWRQVTTNTWRQKPELSGGGFLFDTGAHLLNTVADLAGEDFVEVGAWLDNRGAPVDITGSVMARLASGALASLNGYGETIPSCALDVRVFCSGSILRTGVCGERLQIHRNVRVVRFGPAMDSNNHRQTTG